MLGIGLARQYNFIYDLPVTLPAMTMTAVTVSSSVPFSASRSALPSAFVPIASDRDAVLIENAAYAIHGSLRGDHAPSPCSSFVHVLSRV